MSFYRVERVNNGWILTLLETPQHSGEAYVFNGPAELTDFLYLALCESIGDKPKTK